MVSRRFVLAWALGGLLIGCDCGEGGGPTGAPDAGVDAQAPAPDATADSDAATDGGIDDPDCNRGTGEGCACEAEGETRWCVIGSVLPCEQGSQACTVTEDGLEWGPCVGLGELCNGADDDCDGEIDEGLADLACGIGVCATTAPACVDGAAQVCVPGPPGHETCNGLDDDCDDEVDEGLGNVSCGVGQCGVTVPACSNGAPAVCVPSDPVDESCDGLDNDCNGIIDDGFGTVTCGTGECIRIVLDCDGAGGVVCEPGAPAPEVCNGLDDDCDGVTDDEIPDVACGVGACARGGPGCVGGVAPGCDPGQPTPEACNGTDDDCDGMTDEGLADLECGVGECRRTAAACVGGAPNVCVPGSAVAEVCANRADDDCDGEVDEECLCDPDVDADFDGADQCDDCDDTNGAVFPGQDERCNGIDDDCDDTIDEDFDADADGYGRCSDDPELLDCDDARASVNPGALEDCGALGTGNGIDDDCDGYVDETCDPCDPIDRDGDRVSECMGDCDDADPLVAPGLVEACDGLDTDCNRFTTENCGVSDPCNFPTDDDVCREDLLCACVVGNGGNCTGNYVCSSFCEGSYTGPLGAGCTDDQTCLYRITLSDNQHGCAETEDPIGALGSGAACDADADCRSGRCDRLCIGPGCNQRYCLDWCDHHDPGADGSCEVGTVCEVVSIAPQFGAAMYATCRLDDNGSGVTGDACAGQGAAPCLWGPASCVDGVCAQPCGLDAQCPAGTHCSLLGQQVTVGIWGAGAPAFVDGEDAIETVPVCLADGGAGPHDRQAGAACDANDDCDSEMCDATLAVCLALCTSDETCPVGLGCELQYVRTPPGVGGGVVAARVCVSAPVDAILESM